jgi:hypothetical protein
MEITENEIKKIMGGLHPPALKSRGAGMVLFGTKSENGRK